MKFQFPKDLITIVLNLFKTSKERTVNNKATTVAGGVGGVIMAGLIGKLEEMSGCHFVEAFANIDWIQLAVFGYSLVAGALTTDANKTVSVPTTNTGSGAVS